MGLLDSLGLPQPAEWSGSSAGAAMSLIASTGRTEEVLGFFVDATRANRRNVYPLNAFIPRRKVFPHEAMYRNGLACALDGTGWETLRRASPVRVLLAYVRPGEPFGRSLLGAIRGYRRRSRQRILHGDPDLPRGVATETVTLQTVDSPQTAVDTIMTSSATWPITALPRVAGRTYIDAGAVDALPVRALSARAQRGKILVLLSDCFPHAELPDRPRRLYLAPADEPSVARWDYASPDKVLATFERGRRDGRRWRSRIQDFLEVGGPA
jgi:predicted acylesterase/phospholipase RssA